MGTWQLSKNLTSNMVINGLDIGYRLIDTAQVYGNEAQVGEGISSSSIPRKDFILATKLWIMNLKPKKIFSSFKESLQKLQTDYVDILYVHWPVFTYKPQKTLPAMNELVEEGTVKHIGISNFPIYRVKEAMKFSEAPIFANQVEMHPMLRQKKLFDFNTKNGIYTVAYSPLGRGKIWDNSILKEIARKHNISVPQVCLTYLMQRGAIPIPKSSSREHLQANFDAVNMKIDAEDIKKIETLPQKRLLNMPIIGPKWDKDD
jgi:2,5-diketo-D-gluconate reductase B